jgi:hypothetical protein
MLRACASGDLIEKGANTQSFPRFNSAAGSDNERYTKDFFPLAKQVTVDALGS